MTVLSRSIIYILFLFLWITPVKAKNCTGRMFNPISDVCWDCIFPISIGQIQIPPPTAERHDTDNYPSPICICPKAGIPTPGLAIGFWEPTRLVDITKRPFCLASMGGKEIIPSEVSLLGMGTEKENNATFHLHWYIAPVISLLNLAFDGLCLESPDFDLAYLTEFDPLFHDDLLSFVIQPESILFANPIAQAACAFDCVASTIKRPVDALFWCAGCQGSLYPFTGNIHNRTNAIQGASMVIEKFIAKLHRQMLLPETSGPEAICMPIPAPIVKKSQYRLQTTIPVTGLGPLGCNAFGKSSFLHESFKEIPYTGEDFGFLIWRKKNCCAL